MSGKNNNNFRTLTSAILFFALTMVVILGIIALIKYKSDSIGKASKDVAPSPVVSITISETPVSIEAEKHYTNLAATHTAPKKQLSSMLVYNADGSLRNEYHYDEYGRLMYFYSHSSVSETTISLTEDFEILSTYTNSKHFGDEYYDLNHKLIRFNNIKNGYEYNYRYNETGELIEESYLTTTGASRLTVYDYDSAGYLHSQTTCLNDIFSSKTEYIYENGRLTTELFSDSSTGTEGIRYTTRYLYDENGLPSAMYKYRTDGLSNPEKPVQWEEYTYDSFGRVVSLAKTCDSADRLYFEEYIYSEDGLEADCNYAYRSALTGEKDTLFESGCIKYCWDTAGNILSKTILPDNKEEITEEKYEYEYDSDYCILKQTNYYNGLPSSSYEYTYYK